MQFGILGPLEATADGRILAITPGRQRELLALLLINANQVMTADRIVDEVWGDRRPERGTRALAFHVSQLRDALAPGRPAGASAAGLETAAGGYVLRVEPDSIDADRFERLARDGHELLTTDPAAARDRLGEALALWRGEALLDVAYAEFAQVEIRRLDELRLTAREDRSEAELALGRHVETVAELEHLVEANPLREHLRCLLMLALYRCGRQAEALRVAGAGRRLLSEELGIDPSPELVRLEQRILVQDRNLDSAGRPPARNPYKGLRPFCEADRVDYFGREALVRRLVARFDDVSRNGRLLVVVGPSGSGKSSAVRAGLIPAIGVPGGDGSPSWRIATMVPGVDPFRELDACLSACGLASSSASSAPAAEVRTLSAILTEMVAAGRHRLLLVIDQLEELFTGVDEATRRRFVDELAAALIAPVTGLVVVATLRADFLHIPLAMPVLGELFSNGIELVPPMTRDELERSIVRPAEVVGVEIEPGLAGEMSADVEGQPGALPLLQYALTELFERSGGRRLTRDGYAAIGRAAGALGRRAEEAWRSLDGAGRDVARQILLDLVDLADGGTATTRRVPRAELESLADDRPRARLIIDELGARGLLTFDRDPVTGAPTVQVAHEALLAHWSRFADWIEDLRDALRTRKRLADAAEEWRSAGRPPDYLAVGTKLDWFQAFARGGQLRLTETEAAYLDASAAEEARLASAEVARIARERRLERRTSVVRRGLVAVLVVGIAVAGLLSSALVGEWQTTGERRDIALAQSLAEVAIARLDTDTSLSVLLALEAADATVSRGYVVEEAYDALQWSLQEAHVPFPIGPLANAVRESPSGARGVFVVEPDVLTSLASDYLARTGRSLTPGECRLYLGTTACPPIEIPGAGARLRVRVGTTAVPAAQLAYGPLVGTHVTVLSELPADASPLLTGFEQKSGISVEWNTATDRGLEAQVETGALPDIAIVSRPSYLSAAAEKGLLVDLTGRVNSTDIASDAGSYATSLGKVQGFGTAANSTGQYGIPIAASVDDLLWYPAGAFAARGYAVPKSPAELTALTTKLRTAGYEPWCLGMEAGAASGSAGAAWVEDLLLTAHGPAAYDRWIEGGLPSDSPEVTSAVDGFGSYIGHPGDVFNGLDRALVTPERIAPLPMFLSGDPRCWLYRGSSTDRAAFPASLADRAAAVPFPVASGTTRPLLGRLYMLVVLRDRPETRRVVQELVAGPVAANATADLCAAGIFALQALDGLAGCWAADEAGRLRASLSARTFRVRALDVLPPKVATAFRGDVIWYVQVAFSRGAPARGAEACCGGTDAAWDSVRAQETP